VPLPSNQRVKNRLARVLKPVLGTSLDLLTEVPARCNR
jgi:hypothetical protein